MIVKEEDSLRKKMKWSLITFVTEIVILLIFWGVPFFIMKDNEFLGVILFLIGVWISRKLCFFLENDIIGMECCAQNPNRENLVHIDFPNPPWIKTAEPTIHNCKKKHRKCNKQ